MGEPIYTVASDSENTREVDQQFPFSDVAIGIDIGTSKCSVAIWNGSMVELLKNPRNQKAMRSYVIFKGETPSGGITEELPPSEKEIFSGGAIFSIKRLIGRVDTDPVVHASKTLPYLVQTLDIGVRPFIAALVNNVWRSTTPEEVLAIFLAELKSMVEIQLKRPVRNVVLTIPVSFSRFQMARIEQACGMAGLQVLRLMSEPTSVALLYAQQQQQQIHENMGSGTEKIALIFNMGAGYCDVAITATAGGVSQIKAQTGLPIGGEDLLQNVMKLVVPDFEKLSSSHNIENIRAMGAARSVVQDAIHKLSFEDKVDIHIDNISRNLSRLEFENVNYVVFNKCKELVMKCLADAKLAADDINDVVMVGGCSKIPMVKNTVLGLLKKPSSYEGIDPFEAAVTGTALEGAITSGVSDPSGSLDLLTIQATPLSLGIRADGDRFVAVVHRNTPIPARKEMIFKTAYDDQTEALIAVFEGEGDKVDENHLLGYFKITGIPEGPKGSVEINVCMDIDSSNALRVFAGVVGKQTHKSVLPFVEVRMPMVDDGHGWCSQALSKIYGSAMGLVSH